MIGTNFVGLRDRIPLLSEGSRGRRVGGWAGLGVATFVAVLGATSLIEEAEDAVPLTQIEGEVDGETVPSQSQADSDGGEREVQSPQDDASTSIALATASATSEEPTAPPPTDTRADCPPADDDTRSSHNDPDPTDVRAYCDPADSGATNRYPANARAPAALRACLRPVRVTAGRTVVAPVCARSDQGQPQLTDLPLAGRFLLTVGHSETSTASTAQARLKPPATAPPNDSCRVVAA